MKNVKNANIPKIQKILKILLIIPIGPYPSGRKENLSLIGRRENLSLIGRKDRHCVYPDQIFQDGPNGWTPIYVEWTPIYVGRTPIYIKWLQIWVRNPWSVQKNENWSFLTHIPQEAMGLSHCCTKF